MSAPFLLYIIGIFLQFLTYNYYKNILGGQVIWLDQEVLENL